MKLFITFFYLFFIVFLASCAAIPSPSACPPLKDYSEGFNQRLAAELEPLQEGSAIIEAMGDYITLRDQVRACR